MAWTVQRRIAILESGKQPSQREDGDGWNGATSRIAVADGAGESIYSGRWASLLVEGFVNSSQSLYEPEVWDSPKGQDFLRSASQEWLDGAPKNPEWNQKPKLEFGSFSTFLGVELKTADAVETDFRALTVGDSNLFHFREGQVLVAFPLVKRSEFDFHPDYINSRTYFESNFKRVEGHLKGGDCLVLATDSVAKWILGMFDEHVPIATFLSMGDSELASFLKSEVEKNLLEDDDLTLLIVEGSKDS